MFKVFALEVDKLQFFVSDSIYFYQEFVCRWDRHLLMKKWLGSLFNYLVWVGIQIYLV